MQSPDPGPVHVAVIVASVREGRFGPRVVDWFLTHLGRHPTVRTDVIDLATTVDPGSLADRLEAAEAFVVVTPEYNHSYPAALKELIDSHRTPWFAKPVAFVSYGGLSGGLRAVEHLRVVFPELHAMTVRDTVSLHNPWGLVDDAGILRTAPVTDQAVDVLVARLLWWARALLAARRAAPYAA
jgi:NAD(P)H-dependent FMN reductase